MDDVGFSSCDATEEPLKWRKVSRSSLWWIHCKPEHASVHVLVDHSLMQQRFYQTMNKNCKLLYSIAFYFTKRMLVVYYVMKARSHVLILLKIFLNLKGWNSEIDLKKESSDISKWKFLKGKLYHSYAKIKAYSCTSFHDSNQISVKRCAAKIEFLFFPLCIRAIWCIF